MSRKMKDSGIEWIGEIPEDWNVVRGKYVMNIIERSVKSTDDVITCFRDGEVTLRSNRRTDGFTMSDKEIGYQGIEPGDLVVHGMDGFAGAIGISDSRGKASPVLIVLNSDNDKRYLMYQLRTMSAEHVFEATSTGIRVRSCDLNWPKLAKLPYVVPHKAEQHVIVQYLDTTLESISNIQSKVRQEIGTLTAYKKSIITEAVTKGLNPNVEMKDSGVEWIGKIPAHWKTYRIANLYQNRNEPGRNDLPMLTVSINTGVSDHELKDEDQDRQFIRSEDKSKYKRVYPGDLVYNMMRAWQGAIGAVRVRGMVSPAYIVAKPMGITEIDSRYIGALLRTPQAVEEIHRLSYGIMDFRLRLYWPEFKNIHICLPDYREQQEIADYLDSECAKIDALIATKQKQLDTLADYKKSLIYEYVTGKKEVPAV